MSLSAATHPLTVPDDGAPARSVGEMLRRAVWKGAIGSGREYYVYDLSGQPGMENYVLRIPKKAHLHLLLNSSTSFTPVKQLVTGMHIGQPLMALNNDPHVTIHARQTGRSLAQIRAKYLNDFRNHLYGDAESYIHMLNDVVALQEAGKNPFIPLFEQACRLGAQGFVTDFSLGNMLLDKDRHRLSLVDQLGHPTMLHPLLKPPAHSVKMTLNDAMLFMLKDALPAREGTGDVNVRYLAAFNAYKDMIVEAKNHVLAHQPQLGPLMFADVSQNQAVALSAPPRTLVQQLNALAKAAHIPGFDR